MHPRKESPAGYVIRPPHPDDAAALASVHVRVWKTTYPGLVDRAKLDALTAAGGVERWERIIAGLDGQEREGVRTRCAVHAATSQIVGFATGGTARDDGAPSDTQLWSLNVLPEHHGTGVAAALLDAVIGTGDAYLWLATGNGRALAFYRKHGFELDGAVQVDEEWSCHESRMVRPDLR
ncbi:GCN5 family acetyltransferase [Tsukamurella pulmonis]|uniref:GNAT family N-acetyltransferase n=1 Tax=Tsukamurella pulmonis TaxID=47312 RepID=UPI000794C065|nr:GNAT family N-acetyltransferase [Tsukamurella pulmonis]KXP09955.1 GCN5 family acetyltransferase [Tsukamurella pulmonis]RDH10466.1 GNAT family N-acetyltransferase [Tsukamurella pulmonis]